MEKNRGNLSAFSMINTQNDIVLQFKMRILFLCENQPSIYIDTLFVFFLCTIEAIFFLKILIESINLFTQGKFNIL